MSFDEHNRRSLTFKTNKVYIKKNFFDVKKITHQTVSKLRFIRKDSNYSMFHLYRIKALKE